MVSGSPALIAAFSLSLALCAQSSFASAQHVPGSPTAQRTVLVELFTSEGCSSCPPADSLLQQLNGKRLASGELIVGLSEHVTYWNHLGWSDPFSSDTFTERQSAYCDRLGAASAYTPQVVIDGAREAVGSDRAAVFQAIHAAATESATSGVALQIRSAVLSHDAVVVTYAATTQSKTLGGVEVYAVVADDLRRSDVARGENTGRTLSHAAVARSLTRVSDLQSGEALSVRVPLPHGADTTSRHLVLFAQTVGTGHVLAIDSRRIEGPGSTKMASAGALATANAP